MKKHGVPAARLIAILLLTLGLAASFAFAEGGWKPESDLDKIYANFCEALEKGDREALDELLAPEWTMFITVPSVQTRASREEFFALFDRAFARDNLKLVVNDVEWGGDETTAWCRVDEYHDWITEKGKPRERSHVLSTHVFEIREGSWKMVHTHHSWIPSPEE